jgi:hypothetical protein
LITTIPIGFSDDKYRQHKLLKIIANKEFNKEILIYMNFSIHTNPIKRNECWNCFNNCDWVLKEINIKPELFYEHIAKSKYILSPEGTGIDCHRIYESFYLHSIPILLTSELDYFYNNLPVIIVNSWNDITVDFLENNYDKYINILDNWLSNNNDWLTPNYWLSNS